MRRTYFVLSLLFTILLINTTKAQDFKFGAKAGFNLSTMNFDEIYKSPKLKAGFQVGGMSEFLLKNQKFAIEADVLFSLQGFKSKDSGTGYSHKVRQNAYYVNIPVMFKWYIIDNLSVAFGPQLGIFLGATDKIITNHDGEEETKTKDNLYDRYKSFDFGLCLGADYFITENIFAGARFDLGLTNVYGGKDYDLKSKNRILTIEIGYRF